MKYYVNGFMYSKDKSKIVLIRKNKPEWQKGLLNGIGGKIEKNETPKMAIIREFEEETRVKTKDTDWKLFATINKETEYIIYFFFAFSDKTFSAKTTEQEIVGIYEVNNLPKKIIPNLNRLIPLSIDKEINFDEPIHIKH